jgi:uncharacterized membrane protein YjfL (UPF0719 family)
MENTKEKTMYLAVEIGNIDLNPVLKGVVATILYFLVGMAVLVIGFYMVDILTPGKLRQMVFVDRRPNAVVIASAMYIALTAVIISAIANSYSQLGQGLVGVAVYGLMGVILLGIALLTLHLVIPGNFHEHVDEPELHPASFAVALMLLAVGGVTAAAVS